MTGLDPRSFVTLFVVLTDFFFSLFVGEAKAKMFHFIFFFNLFLTAFVFLFGTSFLVVGQLSDRVTDGRDECHDSRALTSITRAPLFSLGSPFVESPFFFLFLFLTGTYVSFLLISAFIQRRLKLYW